MIRTLATRFLPLTCLWAVFSGSVRAETVLLKSGGRVEGQILRRPAAGATGEDANYIVRVSDDVLIRIASREVGRVIELSADEREYQRLLPTMPDTAAGHEAMAKWCQEHGLNDQKDFHWQHVLRHDPDHEEARRVLGYSRIRGRWMRADDFMEAQGYIRYKGAWRLPQQVAMEQQQQELEVAQKTWRRDIETWRSWLDGRRSDEAWERLQSIEDPLAAAGLVELLPREPDAGIRELYVDLLARLATPAAVTALLDAAIYDDDVDVRLRCIDYVREVARQQAVRMWSGALRSPDNALVNRAATVLGRLGERAAIPSLIDALVTQHETRIAPAADIRPSFGSSADGTGGFNGLSVGGGPKKVRRNLQNRSVLEALVALTDQNFRYSQADWKNWYIQQRQIPEGVNLRRDES